MSSRWIAALLVCGALAGCATAYQQQGLTGGFNELKLSENSWRVSFQGNAYTSVNRAQEITLVRSAELCLEGGFRHFIVIDGRADVRTSSHTTPVQIGFTRRHAYIYGGDTFVQQRPSSNNTIVCYDEKPQGVVSYDARTLYANASASYQIPPNPKIPLAQQAAQAMREARADAGVTAPSVPALATSTNVVATAAAARPTGRFTYEAEQIAKSRACNLTPMAVLAGSGPGLETYTVQCLSGDVLSVRCEFGNCRLLQ